MSQNTREQWKPIDGFPNYQVSNRGRVKNIETGKVLKNRSNNHGYPYVALPKGDGKSKNMLVHCLVATAFIENPDNLLQVNHRNEIKTDNRVENLEWVSASQNMRHSAHQQSCRINQLSLDGEFIRQWKSSKQIERELGYSQGNIIKCCKRYKNYSHVGGYKWQYVDPSQQHKFKRPVAALTNDEEFVAEFKSVTEASQSLKISKTLIHHCLNGTCKSTHGLRFIYID